MAFSEKLKLEVKRRAHFRCCLCHSLGIEVHHIVPEAEGGPDTIDNAAPLCPSCHETYGANPTKRKFVRETRDFWYELCEKRYASDSEQLSEIKAQLKETVSRQDLIDVKNQLLASILSKGEKKSSTEWSIHDLLSYLYRKNYTETNPCFDLLFHESLWADLLPDLTGEEEEEMVECRQDFLRSFGEETAKRLCLETQEQAGIDLAKPFTERDFIEVVLSLAGWVLLVQLLHRGDLRVLINEKGEILFDAAR